MTGPPNRRAATELGHDGARILARPERDSAGIAGGPAQLADHLADRRIRSDAVDREVVEVRHRRHLRRIEPDDRVIEAVVAGHHGAQRAAILCRFSGDDGAGSAAMRGGEPDQRAGVVGADGGQGAQRLPLTTMPAPPPRGTLSSAALPGPAGPTAISRIKATIAAVTRRCAVCKASLPSVSPGPNPKRCVSLA
ncbi:hypothetical protein I553_2969 [Mycobacterium xenopi 4042]|uniref:Uncharacterized protein n=1 Tax=Mycobacterium xenopi 4042 TaxID=1299334 RepID=X8EFA8_MYCXE|nr:hypothetical protein I553_2969 [Mycobacterium xenopi 4042]